MWSLIRALSALFTWVNREEKSTLLKVKINIRSIDCLKRRFMFHVNSRLFNGTFAFDESKME